MRNLFWLLSFFTASVGFAQTAHDYFFPAREINVSIYNYTFAGINGADQKLTNVYVKDYGDSALITTQSNAIVNMNNKKQPDTWEQMVKVERLEIIAIRGKAKTEKGVEFFNNGGEVLFKIPTKKNEVAEWSSPVQKGAVKTIYRSVFATIHVDGKKRKAVKVSCIQKRNHSGEESVLYVDYYVAGIGRYKRTGQNGVAFEVLSKQTYDPNVPVVN